jgi:hypothetical protein
LVSFQPVEIITFAVPDHGHHPGIEGPMQFIEIDFHEKPPFPF